MQIVSASSTERTEHGSEGSAVIQDHGNLYKVAKLHRQKSLRSSKGARKSNFFDETNEILKPIMQRQFMPGVTDHSKEKISMGKSGEDSN